MLPFYRHLYLFLAVIPWTIAAPQYYEHRQDVVDYARSPDKEEDEWFRKNVANKNSDVKVPVFNDGFMPVSDGGKTPVIPAKDVLADQLQLVNEVRTSSESPVGGMNVINDPNKPSTSSKSPLAENHDNGAVMDLPVQNGVSTSSKAPMENDNNAQVSHPSKVKPLSESPNIDNKVDNAGQYENENYWDNAGRVEALSPHVPEPFSEEGKTFGDHEENFYDNDRRAYVDPQYQQEPVGRLTRRLLEIASSKMREQMESGIVLAAAIENKSNRIKRDADENDPQMYENDEAPEGLNRDDFPDLNSITNNDDQDPFDDFAQDDSTGDNQGTEGDADDFLEDFLGDYVGSNESLSMNTTGVDNKTDVNDSASGSGGDSGDGSGDGDDVIPQDTPVVDMINPSKENKTLNDVPGLIEKLGSGEEGFDNSSSVDPGSGAEMSGEESSGEESSGEESSGEENSGEDSSGEENSGEESSGEESSGEENSGDESSGEESSGEESSGEENSGEESSGEESSGEESSGEESSGEENSGEESSGEESSGEENSGEVSSGEESSGEESSGEESSGEESSGEENSGEESSGEESSGEENSGEVSSGEESSGEESFIEESSGEEGSGEEGSGEESSGDSSWAIELILPVNITSDMFNVTDGRIEDASGDDGSGEGDNGSGGEASGDEDESSTLIIGLNPDGESSTSVEDISDDSEKGSHEDTSMSSEEESYESSESSKGGSSEGKGSKDFNEVHKPHLWCKNLKPGQSCLSQILERIMQRNRNHSSEKSKE